MQLYNYLLATAGLMIGAQAEVISQCNQAGQYAMTFDDGPAQYTSQLLDNLAAKGVKATFHVTTKYLSDPSIQSTIQRIAAAGHLIGLRTEASWNLKSMTDDQIRAGIARQANVLANFIGYTPKFVRLPYDGYDDRVLKAVESTGAVVTQQNLETYDYTKDGNRVLNAVDLALSLAGNGQGSFIAVQHDGVQESVAVVPKLVDTIKGNGYKLVTLDACLGMGDMTKNKTPLKGGDGKTALPMGNPIAGNLPSGPSAPAGGKSGAAFPDAASEGPADGLSSQQGANSAATQTAGKMAFVALAMASLFLF